MIKFNQRIWVFIGIAYTFSWVLWLPLLINSRFGGSIPVLPGQYFLASFGPLVGAFVTTLCFDGPQGLLKWMKRTFNGQVRSKVWLLVCGLPILYFVFSVMVQRVFWGHWVNWITFGQTEKLPGFSTGLTLIAWMVTFGLGEETGWRGFLLPEFQQKKPLLKSSLLVAGIWMFWHLPVFFFNENYMGMGLGVIGWVISLTYGSILLAWLARESQWSILPLMIWHGGFNLVTASDQSGEIIAMATSFLVILHGVYLSRKLWLEEKGLR